MRRICARLAIAAFVAAGMATATGFLAPWWPAADMPNHFTPFILAVAIAGLAVLSFAARELATDRRARTALALGLGGVAAINTVPLIASPGTTAVAAQG